MPQPVPERRGGGEIAARLGDLLRGARGNELAASLAALGTQVEHPAGLGDQGEVVETGVGSLKTYNNEKARIV